MLALGDLDLPALHFVAYEVPDCAICMEKMTDGLAVLACGHVLHEKCVQPLIHHRNGGSCPICRAEFRARDFVKLILSIPGKVVDFTKYLGVLSGLGQQEVSTNGQILEKAATLQAKLDDAKKEIDEREKEISKIKEDLGIQQHKANVLKEKFINLTTVSDRLQTEMNNTKRQLTESQETARQALEELVLKQEKIQNYESIITNNAQNATIDFKEELAQIEQLTQNNDVYGLSKRSKDLLCQCIKQEGRMEANERNHRELEEKHQQLKDRFRKLLEITKEKPLPEEPRRSSTFAARDSGQQEIPPQRPPTNANSPAQALQPTSGANAVFNVTRPAQIQMPRVISHRAPQAQPQAAQAGQNTGIRTLKPSIFDRAANPAK